MQAEEQVGTIPSLSGEWPAAPVRESARRRQADKADANLSCELITSVEALEARLDDWRELVSAATEPNVFYEPWMLLPALSRLRETAGVSVLLVYRSRKVANGTRRELCGLIPLELRNSYGGPHARLRVRTLALWRYRHCFLCTPLIRAGFETTCLRALFDWLNDRPFGASLMEFGTISGDGPLNRAMADYFTERGTIHFVAESHTRALFRPDVDGAAFLEAAISDSRMNALRRAERRLARLGDVEYVALERLDESDGWIERFLELEGRGWKGEEGTALACNADDAAYFRSVAHSAHDEDRLGALALRLNGEDIAHVWYFKSTGGSAFAFKTAYDERYARYSPGVLVQLHRIKRLHEEREIGWMDSCTSATSQMRQLWPGRRVVQTIVVGTGRVGGDLVVSSLPLIRWTIARARKMAVVAHSLMPEFLA